MSPKVISIDGNKILVKPQSCDTRVRLFTASGLQFPLDTSKHDVIYIDLSDYVENIHKCNLPLA